MKPCELITEVIMKKLRTGLIKSGQAALIVSLFTLMSFASCSGGGNSDKVVLWVSHGPPDNGYLSDMVDIYNATNPDVQVKFVQVPGSQTDAGSGKRSP